MSESTYEDLEELHKLKSEYEQKIVSHRAELSVAQFRLSLVDKRIRESTQIKLTLEQIEKLLGHKVILV